MYLYGHVMDILVATFLKWSKNGKSLDETDEKYPKYLTANYFSGKCHELHQRLIDLEYLIEADAESILSSLKVVDLKDILSEHALPTSGKKQTLIKRIIENISIKDLDIQRVYIPSDKGIEHMNKYGEL